MIAFIIMLALAVPLVFLAMMALVAGAGSKEADNPDEALDKAFTGERTATWQITIGGLSERQVIEGADARGYRLTTPAGRSGLMVFAKESAGV